ncbi:DUF58 domain-containing protein [Pirellulaceae bacterium SH449]
MPESFQSITGTGDAQTGGRSNGSALVDGNRQSGVMELSGQPEVDGHSLSGSEPNPSQDEIKSSIVLSSDLVQRTFWSFLLGPIRRFRSMRRSATPVTTRLTREGWQFSFMIGFVILGAVVRNVNLLIILAGTMIGFLLIQWRVSARSIYGITARRKLPRNMQARKPFDVEVSVTNPKRFLGAWWIVVEERMTKQSQLSLVGGAAQTIGMLFSTLPPRSTRIQRYQCIVPNRGAYQFLGMEITTRFPLGLMKGILPPSGQDSIIVQPAIGKLLPSWTDLFETKRAGARHRQSRSISDEGEFFGLRSYRPGDSPRLIHWRSSARFGELMVKQFQRTETREFVIVLDLSPLDPEETGSVEKTNGRKAADALQYEDLAVEFVSSMAQHICASNHAVLTVAIADADPALALRVQTRTQTHALQERLGIAKSAKVSNFIKALQLLEKEVRHVDHLLVVSTRRQPGFLPASDRGNSTEKQGLPTSDSGEAPVVYWRHMAWVNVANKELEPYFSPAP